MWMGCNISTSGITKDLEAMKEAGIGGATIFSLADSTIPWAGMIGKSPTPEIVAFTEPWWEMVRHAAAQSHRLGLELILHNCAGYESSGGPWITPELSMQEVIWSKTMVQGGTHFQAVLERATVDPHPHAQFPQVYMPELGRVDIPIVKARQTYYRDIAVIAVPSNGIARKDQVTMITDRMDKLGMLDWQVPDGLWTIYRFGHTTTGAMIQPAQWEAMGLECDKMNKDAVTFHVQYVLADMKKHLGDLMGKGISTLYFDSYEAGSPNWTPKMREEFNRRRGYDLTPWLPTLAGHTVEDQSQTDKFKVDFKRTIYDLYRDCYWATPGPLAREAGVKFAAEPYEGPWEISEVVRSLDLPVVEFWTNNGKYFPQNVEPVMKAAHAIGAKIVAAESFTTAPEFGKWNEHPGWLKPIGDEAFCAGINRVNLHHFVQQPWDSKYKPGNVMGQWGVHFGRNQTWWEPGKAWLAYLWRCQNLLQRGQQVEPSETTSASFLGVPEPSGEGKPEFKSIRRDLGDASIFFIANVSRSAGAARVSFPVRGLQPELWDPVWGTMRDLSSYEQTPLGVILNLDFEAAQSFFVVFRKPATPPRESRDPGYRTVATIEGRWDVSFDPAWGAPASAEFEKLIDWTTHPDPGIKYYSGTAIYRKKFAFEATSRKPPLFLDIGKCNHLAQITVNGRQLGVLWTAPWRINVTKAVKPGENKIEIAVTNVWANRLIGDEQQQPDWIWEVGDPKIGSGEFMKEFPDWFLKGQPRPCRERYTFTTWNYFKKDSPLTPSGLLGPVRLLGER
jgi:hypothetical protein